MSATLTDEIRVARKAHRCDWCGEKIKAGERYSYSSGVDAGTWFDCKLHTECLTAVRREQRNEGSDFDLDPFFPGDRWRGLTYYETDEMRIALREAI